MAKKFLTTSIVAIALLAIVGAFLSQDYSVYRTIVIDAKPSAIHKYVGDLKRWPEWGPWKDVDPSIKVTLGKKTSGVGAERSWTSDRGEGKLVFTESSKKTGIAYDMTFGDGTSESSIRYEIEGKSTRVTWNVVGVADIPVLGGYYALWIDGAIGDQFDKGLAKLKRVVES